MTTSGHVPANLVIPEHLKGPYVRPDSRWACGPAHILCPSCGSHRTFYIDDDVRGVRFGCDGCEQGW